MVEFSTVCVPKAERSDNQARHTTQPNLDQPHGRLECDAVAELTKRHETLPKLGTEVNLT